MNARNEELLRSFAGAWSGHDPDEIAGFFADDAVYEDPCYGVRVEGRPAIREFVASVLNRMPDFHLEYPFCSAGDRGGFAEYRITATWNGLVPVAGVDATGARLEAIGVTVFELRDGMITRDADYYDFAATLQALGVLPEDLSLVTRPPGSWSDASSAAPVRPGPPTGP